VGNYLRAHLSDRVIPRICTATPIGKMDWHSSGWAVEPVAENDDFMWIRTPYTPGYFKRFAPLANDLDNIGLTMRAPLISSTWPRSAMNRSFWARVRQNLPMVQLHRWKRLIKLCRRSCGGESNCPIDRRLQDRQRFHVSMKPGWRSMSPVPTRIWTYIRSGRPNYRCGNHFPGRCCRLPVSKSAGSFVGWKRAPM
jgi:hypothetical protein